MESRSVLSSEETNPSPDYTSNRWGPWVKSLKNLTSSERLILTELALLADTRGVVLITRKDIAQQTGLSLRTIDRSLLQLERSKILTRTKQRDPIGRWKRSRIQLRDRRREKSSHPMLPLNRGDDLGAVLLAAEAEHWEGEAASELAEMVTTQIGTRLGWICAQLKLDLTEAISAGWMALRANPHVIAGAADPWAYWAKIVARELRATKLATAITPPNRPKNRAQPANNSLTVGVDDFNKDLNQIVGHLEGGGLNSTLAHAATARALELICSLGPESASQHIRTDPRLTAMGLNLDQITLLTDLSAALPGRTPR